MVQSTQQPRLVECNKCKANGFPGQMIQFQKTDKKKPDGKPVWLLLNPDMTGHTHIQPGTIQDKKPPPRPAAFVDMVVDQTQTQNQDAMVQAIQQQTEALKTLSQSIEKLSANVSRILLTK